MPNKEEFDYFAELMLENAVKEFKSTEQYKLLQEKLDRMDAECDNMFTKDQKDFATECFALILEACGQEKLYIYRKGLLEDCVNLLRWMGVLA